MIHKIKCWTRMQKKTVLRSSGRVYFARSLSISPILLRHISVFSFISLARLRVSFNFANRAKSSFELLQGCQRLSEVVLNPSASMRAEAVAWPKIVNQDNDQLYTAAFYPKNERLDPFAHFCQSCWKFHQRTE